MNVDDRRFLRRHWPGWVPNPEKANDVLYGETLAVRTDGMAFYVPSIHPGEVWVAWLANGPSLKSSPATRRLCSYEEYLAELASRRAEIAKLFGEES